MTSLYRELNEAAFEMNLNKNQLLVFNAMLNQTLGYGKTNDPLTDKRIAKITGVRVDRARPAIAAVVKKGLFDRKPHKRYQYEYFVGKTFLEAHQGKVYTPSAPKERAPSENENPTVRNDENLTQMGQNQPEKATHTITNQTLSNPQQQPIQNKQTQNQTISNQQQQNTPIQNQTVSHQQPQQSVKLFFAELEQIPNNFAIETSANTRVEFAIGNTATTVTNNETTAAMPSATENQPETNTEPEPEEAISTPETLATLKKLLAIMQQPDTNTDITPEPETEPATTLDTSHHIEPSTDNINLPPQPDLHDTQPLAPQQAPTTNPVCCRDDNVDKKPQDNDNLLVVPQAVGAENIAACNRAFSPLSPKQKQDVLTVFKYNNSMGTIKNATGYFIGLTKSAKAGGLTVPDEAIVKAEPSAETIAADKEQQRRYDLWSKFTWLQENAGEHDTDLSTFAQQMGMEEAYAMYAHTLQTMN